MNDDLISRQAAIDKFKSIITDREYTTITDEAKERIARKFFADIPSSDAVEVVRCKDCKYQEKFFHEDKRRKEGGYYIFGCELVDGYSHVCLDDDFCSRAERI